MKHIRRKITVSVLGTMLFVFAALLATVNIFIPEYLTSEAQKAILLEDERKDPIPLSEAMEAMDDEKEHFLTSSVRHFGAPRLDNWNRITVGSEQEMDALLDAIADIIKEEKL